MAVCEAHPTELDSVWADRYKAQMAHYLRAAVLLSIAGILPSCHGQSAPAQPGTVSHVVLMWMKNPQDAEARQRLIASTETFRSIPGVLRMTYGPAVPSTR